MPDDFVKEEWRGNRSDNRSGITINNLGKTSIVLLATFTGLALGVAVFSYVSALHDNERAQTQAKEAERENRMLEYYVMELDGKLMKSGMLDPRESWSAKKAEREKHK